MSTSTKKIIFKTEVKQRRFFTKRNDNLKEINVNWCPEDLSCVGNKVRDDNLEMKDNLFHQLTSVTLTTPEKLATNNQI